jgi:hypothetical protein
MGLGVRVCTTLWDYGGAGDPVRLFRTPYGRCRSKHIHLSGASAFFSLGNKNDNIPLIVRQRAKEYTVSKIQLAYK